jgi:cephalosporin hydroxylase
MAITLTKQLDMMVRTQNPKTAIKKWNRSIANTEYAEYEIDESLESLLINDVENLGFVQGLEWNECGYYIWLNIYSNR